LNCLYLVVMHFPEAELASQWSSLIFVAAAARLPQESDPVAHQMLHVLIKALLGRVGGSAKQRLVDVALPWRHSPKRALHVALAECLGLFAEADPTNAKQLLPVALPALAGVLGPSIQTSQDILGTP